MTLPGDNHQFQVYFKAERDKDTHIAIDNLVATPGDCVRNVRQFCDFDARVNKIEGDIDHCNWLTFEKTQFWTWRINVPGDVLMEPSAETDHSSHSSFGKYLTFGQTYDHTNKLPDDWRTKAEPLTASLPLVDGDFGPHCLSFWYWRPKKDMNEIQVIYKPVTGSTPEGAGSDGNETILWSSSTHDSWTKAQVKNDDSYRASTIFYVYRFTLTVKQR